MLDDGIPDGYVTTVQNETTPFILEDCSTNQILFFFVILTETRWTSSGASVIVVGACS